MTRSIDDAPFLPAAPPPWAARALAWILLAMFAVVAGAAVIVRVPESVSATFVIVAAKGSSPIRALHAGVITSVRVADAEEVQAGAPLFTLRSESAGDRSAERAALATSLDGGSSRQANELQRHASERRADDQEAARLAGRVIALEAQATLAERQASLAREVAARNHESYERGLTSWLNTTASRLEADRLAASLEQVRADLSGTRSELERLRFQMASRQAAYAELTRQVDEELAQARTRKGLLDAEGLRDGNAITIAAECAGTVAALLVRSPGAIVAEGDRLAEIVCRNDGLQVELQVPQRGFALVAPGQTVKLRYDAFPYERYGVRYATLRWTSPASTTGSGDGTFRALADLGQASVPAGGRLRPILPGMRGQASVIVGRRSIASFALAPLRRVRDSLASGPGDDR